jgi:hypothetical protein
MSAAILLALAAAPAQSQLHAARAVWEYSVTGSGIGLSDLVAVDVAGQPELFGGTGTFGGNDFWYALRRDAASGAWEWTFASPLVPAGIVRMDAGPLLPFAGQTLVLLRGDGAVELHDPPSKSPLGSISTGITAPTSLDLADLNGDGYEEILVADASRVRIFDVGGSLLGTCNGGGGDVLAAQMDGDPQLEIAVTSGIVFDGATLAAQWTWPAGFGRELAAEDLDGDGMAELVAMEDWNFVWCYNVDLQLPWWSLPRFDNDAIRLADVEGDGSWELLVGDGQWGSVNCFDARTLAFEWSVPNPEHGVADLLLLDADGDGDRELAWSAGHSSTGPDFLYVADWQTGAWQWRSEHLDGPFVGPELGDVDGDGRPEFVVASFEAESGYDSGRILVFDAATFALEAMSAPVVGNLSWTGIHDLALADVDGDGDVEIAIAADRLYDGVIEIYDRVGGALAPVWSNATPYPSGAPFHSVAVADADGDGDLEVIGGGGREHTGAAGVFLYVYDFATRLEEWHSVQMGGYWDRVSEVAVADLDMDGATEIAGLVANGGIYVFDGASRALEAILPGPFTAMAVHEHMGMMHLLAGDALGRVAAYVHGGAGYVRVYQNALAAGPVDGITGGRHGHAFVSGGGRVRMVMVHDGMVMWQSDDYGAPFGARVPAEYGQPDRFVTAGRHAIVAFEH